MLLQQVNLILYVAEPRACEWDIAAGHAILEHAGGKVTDFNG